MKKIKIGLLGLLPNSTNKGCEALTYSFFELVKQCLNFNITFYFIEPFGLRNFLSLKSLKDHIYTKNKFLSSGIKVNFINFRYYKNRFIFLKNVKKLDFCIDFTEGDSFTDIYGNDRFLYWTKLKETIINRKIPLILGSQTIGPFSEMNKNYAISVINKCCAVFTRDIKSFQYVKSNSVISPILTTDVAFFLPFNKKNNISHKIKIGINPSGLLWNGGYTSDNQFNLTLNYKEFCRECIKVAIKIGAEIHLIGHVISNNFDDKDNDCVAIKELHKEYPNTIVAPIFNSPVEAKNYISGMNGFIGARMHATIAAISSSVPVLPFSYSRKFEGLFETLDYHIMVHGQKDTFQQSLIKIDNFLKNICQIANNEIINSNHIIDKLKTDMIKNYSFVFNKLIYPDSHNNY